MSILDTFISNRYISLGLSPSHIHSMRKCCNGVSTGATFYGDSTSKTNSVPALKNTRCLSIITTSRLILILLLGLCAVWMWEVFRTFREGRASSVFGVEVCILCTVFRRNVRLHSTHPYGAKTNSGININGEALWKSLKSAAGWCCLGMSSLVLRIIRNCIGKMVFINTTLCTKERCNVNLDSFFFWKKHKSQQDRMCEFRRFQICDGGKGGWGIVSSRVLMFVFTDARLAKWRLVYGKRLHICIFIMYILRRDSKILSYPQPVKITHNSTWTPLPLLCRSGEVQFLHIFAGPCQTVLLIGGT
jgi:hypothetical protein